jgi:hypothetical protein
VMVTFIDRAGTRTSMYIGIGTVVLILVILLIIALARRA